MSVRHAMLALLSEGPSYGLQLREEFEARTGDVWPLNVGQVYTTLQRLERDGLVISEGEDEGPRLSPGGATPRSIIRAPRSAPDGEASVSGAQKMFRITADGMRELDAWLRTPPDLSSPPRDELVMKILIALRVPGANVSEVIQAHRRYLVELMQQWTRIKEDADPADLSLGLAVDAELFRLDAVVRWLDAADGRIKRAAADAVPASPGPAETAGAPGRAAGDGAPARPAAPAAPATLGPLPRIPLSTSRKVRERR
jgi:DNA-binding PadR family transcriptional regulator